MPCYMSGFECLLFYWPHQKTNWYWSCVQMPETTYSTFAFSGQGLLLAVQVMTVSLLTWWCQTCTKCFREQSCNFDLLFRPHPPNMQHLYLTLNLHLLIFFFFWLLIELSFIMWNYLRSKSDSTMKYLLYKFSKTYLVEPACECDHIGRQTVFLFPIPSTAGQLLPIRKSH